MSPTIWPIAASLWSSSSSASPEGIWAVFLMYQTVIVGASAYKLKSHPLRNPCIQYSTKFSYHPTTLLNINIRRKVQTSTRSYWDGTWIRSGVHQRFMIMKTQTWILGQMEGLSAWRKHLGTSGPSEKCKKTDRQFPSHTPLCPLHHWSLVALYL